MSIEKEKICGELWSIVEKAVEGATKELKAENEKLKKGIAIASSVSNDLSSDLLGRIEKAKGIGEDLERLRDFNAKHLEKFQLMEKESANQITELEAQISTLKSERSSLRTQLYMSQEEVGELKRQIEEIKGNIILSKDNANKGGRPPALSPSDIELVKKLHSQGDSYRKIADKMGVSPSTVSKAMNESKEEDKSHLSSSFQ